eukprot:scaffold1060_cov385-Pavlova_lutheri.AAC.1
MASKNQLLETIPAQLKARFGDATVEKVGGTGGDGILQHHDVQGKASGHRPDCILHHLPAACGTEAAEGSNGFVQLKSMRIQNNPGRWSRINMVVT